MSNLLPEYKSPIVKVCSQCGETRAIDEFNFRNRSVGTRHSYCRDCGKLLTRRDYAQNKRQYLKRNSRSFNNRREYVRQKKSQPCADCGIKYPFYVMDFDHREGELKKYELNRIDRITMRALMNEIEKCDVVCANCHRIRTYQRLMKKRLSGKQV